MSKVVMWLIFAVLMIVCTFLHIEQGNTGFAVFSVLCAVVDFMDAW
jgi:hypothetical protein